MGIEGGLRIEGGFGIEGGLRIEGGLGIKGGEGLRVACRVHARHTTGAGLAQMQNTAFWIGLDLCQVIGDPYAAYI